MWFHKRWIVNFGAHVSGTELLTAKEAAVFLGISRRTLSRMTAAKSLPILKLNKQKRCKLLFDKDELLRFLKRGEPRL